jgi:hypothetical protein
MSFYFNCFCIFLISFAVVYETFLFSHFNFTLERHLLVWCLKELCVARKKKGSYFFHTSACLVDGCRNGSFICCRTDRIVWIGVNDLFVFYPFPKPYQEPHSRNRFLRRSLSSLVEENYTGLLVPSFIVNWIRNPLSWRKVRRIFWKGGEHSDIRKEHNLAWKTQIHRLLANLVFSTHVSRRNQYTASDIA